MINKDMVYIICIVFLSKTSDNNKYG